MLVICWMLYTGGNMIIIRRALYYQTRRRESCINHKLIQPLERTATILL